MPKIICSRCGKPMTLCLNTSDWDGQVYKCEWCEGFYNEKIEHTKKICDSKLKYCNERLQASLRRIHELECEIVSMKNKEQTNLLEA